MEDQHEQDKKAASPDKEAQVEQMEADKDIVLKESEYKKLVDDTAAFKDKYIRILAEFENARKRNERERAELIKYAHEEVIIEVLGLYEDMERSLEAAKKFTVDANIVKGLDLIVGRMRELLKSYDVKPVDSVGKKFDPFQKGYWLGDRVVRTAKVKVAKNNK